MFASYILKIFEASRKAREIRLETVESIEVFLKPASKV
jgi:hypothetical protein